MNSFDQSGNTTFDFIIIALPEITGEYRLQPYTPTIAQSSSISKQ